VQGVLHQADANAQAAAAAAAAIAQIPGVVVNGAQ